MNVIVELQKSATPKVVLNQLYKHTPLQSSFGFNMLALVPVGEPRLDGSVAMEPRVLRSSRCSSSSSRRGLAPIKAMERGESRLFRRYVDISKLAGDYSKWMLLGF